MMGAPPGPTYTRLHKLGLVAGPLLFVICAFAATTVMVFQFGEVKAFWERPYQIAIHFENAAGIHPGTLVRKNGIRIGEVRHVEFDPDSSGVLAVAEIDERYQLRVNSFRP